MQSRGSNNMQSSGHSSSEKRVTPTPSKVKMCHVYNLPLRNTTPLSSLKRKAIGQADTTTRIENSSSRVSETADGSLNQQVFCIFRYPVTLDTYELII